MTDSRVSPAASPAGDLAQREGWPGGPPPVPSPPATSARPSGWTPGRITALAIGALLVLVSIGLLGVGGTGLWADLTQRDPAGYVTTDVHAFSTSGSALVTDPVELDSPGVGWLYSSVVLGEGSYPGHAGGLRLAGLRGDRSSNDVDRYLAGVNHTLISEFWGTRCRPSRFCDRIRARNAGVLGRLRHRPWGPDADLGSGQRSVDRRRDERRRATRDRRGGGPGSYVSGTAGHRHRLVGGRGIFLIGGALLIGGAIRRSRAPSSRLGGGDDEDERHRDQPIRGERRNDDESVRSTSPAEGPRWAAGGVQTASGRDDAADERRTPERWPTTGSSATTGLNARSARPCGCGRPGRSRVPRPRGAGRHVRAIRLRPRDGLLRRVVTSAVELVDKIGVNVTHFTLLQAREPAGVH